METEPIAADRLTIALGGEVVQMKQVGNVWWPVRGRTFMELRETDWGWSLKTLENVEYVFEQRVRGAASSDDGMWVLSQVRDSVGGDKIDLSYDVPDDDECPAGLSLAKLSYGFDEDAGEHLYDVELNYDAFWRPAPGTTQVPGCGHRTVSGGEEYAQIFDVTWDDGFGIQRGQVLRDIVVKARNNVEHYSASKKIRGYHFAYDADPTTDRPRLRTVTTTGEEGVAGATLPVATYHYGSLATVQSTSSSIHFGKAKVIDRPGLPIDFTDDIASTVVTATTDSTVRIEHSRARNMIRDFTGDGLPDLVYRDGDNWVVKASRLTETGPQFDGLVSTWSQPAELFEQKVRSRTIDHAEARAEMITTETWSQYLDWDGDGRIDVIDAMGGDDQDHWKVWLNRKAADGKISWVPVQVDISPVRQHLRQPNRFLQDSERVAIERSRTWPRSERKICTEADCIGATCDPWRSCDEPDLPLPNFRPGIDTMYDWKLADLNQDGYPDVVAGTIPVRLHEDGTWDDLDPTPTPVCFDEPHGTNNPYIRHCRFEHRQWIDAKEWSGLGDQIDGNDRVENTNRLVSFLNRHGAFQGINGSPFPVVGHLGVDAGEGVEHWKSGSSDGTEAGTMRGVRALVDPYGEGELRMWDASVLPVFESDRPTACEEFGASFESRQTEARIDFDGDGIADSVGGGVRTHGRVHALTSEDLPVSISTTKGSCRSLGSNVGGLLDLDADGHPDLLHIFDGQLRMASIVPGEGDLLSTQRLVRIENGYGAETYFRYRNAKLDRATPHHVPFPEIVVTEIGTVVVNGSGTGPAPTYFAYGGAEMAYDALSGSWIFPGYRRQVTLRGTTMPGSAGMIEGMVTISDRAPLAPAGSSYEAHLTSGQVSRVAQLEMTMVRDPWLMLWWNGDPLHGEATQEHAALVLSDGQVNTPPVVPPEALECADLDPTTGEMVTTHQCRKTGLMYAEASTSWQGEVAPPQLANVMAGSEVAEVDDYGRPTSLVGLADRRRTDDDVCTTVEYATPAGGGVFPSVISSIVLTNCGLPDPSLPTSGTPRTIAAVRFRYDGLPHGQVSRGQLTARDVDRYSPFGLLGSHEVEAFTYNTLGEVETASSTRTLGSAATRATTFTYDDFGETTTEVSVQASDTPHPLVTQSRVSTWPSRGSEHVDVNGVVTRTEYDGHGRVLRQSVETGSERTTRLRYTYDDNVAGRRTTLETFPGTTAFGSENTAPERVSAHTPFDALGRARYTQVELGTDYGGLSLVSGLTVYDELGRPRFVAQPFESAQLPFVIPAGNPDRYGTTTVYDRRGRAVRQVTARGINTSMFTDVASDVYVRATAYGYESGQSIVRFRGPAENELLSVNFGFSDESRTTAIGRELRRGRVDENGAAYDLVEQDWDRLGRVIKTRRYADPGNAANAVVWTSQYDSLGRLLSFAEPDVSPRTYVYDEDGNEIFSSWLDGAVTKGTETHYDGLGRTTIRRLRADAAIESEDRFYWDVPVGGADQPVSDLVGRLSGVMTVDVGSVYFSYDAYGRTATTSYRYDAHGDLIRESSDYEAGGRLRSIGLATPRIDDHIQYKYDSAGRVRAVFWGNTALFQAVDISAKGQYREVVYDNGVIESFEYAVDGPEELLSQRVQTQDGPFLSRYLKYDAAGRIEIESHDSPSSSMTRGYEFDQLGRVTAMAQVGGVNDGVETYRHNPLGGIITRFASTGAGDRHYAYAPSDLDRLCRVDEQVTNGAPCELQYDGAGSITVDRQIPGAETERYFTYDPSGRLVKARKGTNIAAFTFGPAGRALTRVDSENARSVWHFGGLLEEVWPDHDPSNIRTQRRVPGPLGIVASLRFDGTEKEIVYSHGDARGNRFFTNADGAVIQEATYSLFGKVTSDTGSQTSLSYTDDLWNGGDHLPEVGLTILGARAYDPELGRFLQRDPIINTRRSITANPYAFAFNDPVNLTDPTGMQPAESPTAAPTPMDPVTTCWLMCGSRKKSITPSIDSSPNIKGILAGGHLVDIAGTRVGRPITLHRFDPPVGRWARTILKNLPSNPASVEKRVRGALNAAESTGRAGVTLAVDCWGQPSCMVGVTLYEAGRGAARTASSIDQISLSGLWNAACPDDDCNETSGALAVGALAGAGGEADDVLRMAAGAADDAAAGIAAAGGTAEAAAVVEGAASHVLFRTPQQLQAKFKHAKDFGVTGNYSKLNAAQFSRAIHQHINNPGVRSIPGTFHKQPVTHYVNPSTGLNVIVDSGNNFISAWRLSPGQLQNVLAHGGL